MIRELPQLEGVGSLSGVCRRLAAWRLARKRSRDYLHSPDPHYDQKLVAVQERLRLARERPEQEVLLYGDEFTCYRQPVSGLAYERRGRGGRAQPKALRSYRANTKWRLAGALDAVTGRVCFRASSHMGCQELSGFLRHLRQRYGPAPRLSLVWDNWPVHYHAQVLRAAQEASVEVLFLPTYAPWTNPIEKLWGQLKDELLRLHPWADAWEALKQEVKRFLLRFDQGSPALLHRVGLLPEWTPA